MRAADAHDAGFWCEGQLMLMMLASGAEKAWGHVVGAADAHDAGFWCGMAIG